jgi:hypothetical protein
MLFSSLALATWFNQLLDSHYLGHLLMGGIYFVLMLIVVIFRDHLKIKEWIEEKLVESTKKTIKKNEQS